MNTGTGWVLGAVMAILNGVPAQAADPYVPEPLKAWVPWVTAGEEYRDCPFLMGTPARAPGDFRCAWPGLLSIDADAAGARFTQAWQVSGSEQWIPLPGGAEHWPAVVSVDGRVARVFERGGAPALRLAPGDYRIAGRFSWNALPPTLPVPGAAGLIALTLDGVAVPRPQRSGDGVFLGSTRQAARSEDALTVQVYRLLEDGIPSRLITMLRLEVAGAVREQSLGPVLPEGFVPEALKSPFPARISADGNLQLQLTPGSWTLTVTGRAGDLVDALARPAAAAPWPAVEVWSYRGDDQLRIAVPVDVTAVDPGQAGVPGSWARLPAFRVGAGDGFVLDERRRGGDPADNEITLSRNLWLDFDGSGLTAVDQLRGTMHRAWRLDMRPPFALMGARDSAHQPLLVTVGEDGAAGIEWRDQALALQAVSRLESGGSLPASGWSNRVTRLDTRVHLPPGYRLAAALGADQAAGAWLNRWQLLDLFVVLLASAVAGRLHGRAIGALCLVTLTLTHQDLPAFSWLLLNLLAAAALVRVAPLGRLATLARWYRNAGLAALALLFVPFAITQLKLTVYPQLELSAAYSPRPATSAAITAPADPAANLAVQERGMMVAEDEAVSPGRIANLKQAVTAGSARPAPAPAAPPAAYAPGVRVQTGPGLPAWNWHSYLLSWSGPVEPAQTLNLVILPRWLVALWRLGMVALTLAALWWAGRESFAALRDLRLPAAGKAAGNAAGLAIVGLLLAGGAGDAAAQLPSPELLEALQQRVLQPPDCAPDCGAIARAEVAIDAQRLEITLLANTLETLAIPLPGAEASWLPESVSVDGTDSGRVFRDERGVLWLPLAAGEHRVSLSGRVPDADTFQLTFPAPPRQVYLDAQDWTVSGLRGRSLAAGSLQFARIRQAVSDGPRADREGTRFPDYLRVERTISMDLEWSATTRVIRIAPARGSISAAIPLLPGEAVTTADVVVEDGRVRVALPDGQRSFSWRSTLSQQSPLTLTAPADRPWAERWTFDVSAIWSVTLDGVPVYASGGSRWQPVFLPRPGESLRLEAVRPEAIDGAALAVDRASLDVALGARSAQTTLEFDYRSSLGGPHAIALPESAELISLAQDGTALPLPSTPGSLRIPTLPGSHSVRVQWREGAAPRLRQATPAVSLNAPTGNISINATLPQSRWVLLANGPRIGPAVLYWSELAALILAALALGRLRLTPLRTVHWILLGLGFSTFAWPIFALVVVWLLVMGWRGRWPEDMADNRFRIQQSLVGLLSLIALLWLVLSIPLGLLGSPDMHVVGNRSYGNDLHWFQDRAAGLLPVASVVSVPLWIYKVAILLWALWLSFALLRWLPWAWQCFSHGGIWRGRVRSKPEGA